MKPATTVISATVCSMLVPKMETTSALRLRPSEGNLPSRGKVEPPFSKFSGGEPASRLFRAAEKIAAVLSGKNNPSGTSQHKFEKEARSKWAEWDERTKEDFKTGCRLAVLDFWNPADLDRLESRYTHLPVDKLQQTFVQGSLGKDMVEFKDLWHRVQGLEASKSRRAARRGEDVIARVDLVMETLAADADAASSIGGEKSHNWGQTVEERKFEFNAELRRQEMDALDQRYHELNLELDALKEKCRKKMDGMGGDPSHQESLADIEQSFAAVEEWDQTLEKVHQQRTDKLEQIRKEWEEENERRRKRNSDLTSAASRSVIAESNVGEVITDSNTELEKDKVAVTKKNKNGLSKFKFLRALASRVPTKINLFGARTTIVPRSS